MKVTIDGASLAANHSMTTCTIEAGDRMEIGGAAGHSGDKLYGEHPDNVLVTFYDSHNFGVLELAVPEPMWQQLLATLSAGEGNEIRFKR